MITSDPKYNELLYLVNDVNNKIFIEIDLDGEGYPKVFKDQVYYFKENETDIDYLQWKGSREELKEQWPTASQVPTFYRIDYRYYYRIPRDEPIYKIDLNTRTCEVPEFLSVLEDHNSEVLWFQVDRFYDDVDLFGSTCWIQYKNALNETFISVSVPQVVPDTSHDILYIPWPVSSGATRATGNVTFSFQFYKLSEDNQRVLYSIHTKPAISKVLSGLHVDPLQFMNNNSIIDPNPQYTELESLLRDLTAQYATLSSNYQLFWTEVQEQV